MVAMDMARADSGADGLRLRAVETVNAGDRVRHVDQLPPGCLEQFLRAVSKPATGAGTCLEVGEVIVFDEYYLVEPR